MWEILAGASPQTRDAWLCGGRVSEADVWLCYDPGNKTDMWLRCIHRSRCCLHTAITICIDEIRDSAVVDVRWLLSLKVKHKIINVQGGEVKKNNQKIYIIFQKGPVVLISERIS